jgi:protease II
MSLEHYRRRIQRNGSSLQESILNDNKETANRQFHNSLFSEEVLINDVPATVVVTQGKTSEDKTLLFQPESVAYIGDIVKIKENNYLLLDFKGEGISEIYPVGVLKLCNATFPIISDKTRVLIGYDEYQRPVYNYVTNTNQVPCIIESRYSFTRSNQQITLPDNRIEIMIKYVESESLKLDSEFEMRDGTYKIKNIDYSKVIKDKGILIISAERQVS